MKIVRSKLIELLITRLVEETSTAEMEQFFYDHHADYYRRYMDSFELEEIARSYGLLEEDERLEFI